MDTIKQLFEICIFPLLGALTTYLIFFLKAKATELKEKTDSQVIKKYIDMIDDTIITCVIATNQTFVNALKEKGEFNEAAQREAFERCLNAVMSILEDEVLDYIESITSDINLYLTEKIEAAVSNAKK